VEVSGGDVPDLAGAVFGFMEALRPKAGIFRGLVEASSLISADDMPPYEHRLGATHGPAFTVRDELPRWEPPRSLFGTAVTLTRPLPAGNEQQEIPEAFRRRDLAGDQDELPVVGRLDRSRGGRHGRQVPVREVDVQVLRERGQDLGEFADGHGTAPLSTQAAKAPNPQHQSAMFPSESPPAANAARTNRIAPITSRMREKDGQVPRT
jgi:hypothetical protein